MLTVFQQKFYHNTLEHWLISLAIVVATVLFARFIYWFINFFLKQLTSRTSTQLDDVILDQLKSPAIFAIILTGLWYALERLHFSVRADTFFSRAFTLLIAVNITWLFVRILNALIKEFLLPYSQRDDNNLDEQLIRLLQQAVRVILWSLGLVVGLNNAGFDVAALIAGLGIGGLAIALASQDTVKNMFGGVILFLDKPFRIGDRVVIDSMDGLIMDIGIRSTRIRTQEGRLVTIPNAYFSEKPIQNVTQGPFFRVNVTLGLVYSTSYEKMQEAVAILKAIAKENEWLEGDSVVLFEQFSAYSMDIKVSFFIKPGAEIFEVRSTLNFQILKRFKEADLEFAYPTQTVIGRVETVTK
jgi:MscS family membrane protein